MLKEYYTDLMSATEAKKSIQELSFYPMMFQAARVIKSTGVLKKVYENRRGGITPQTLAKELNIPYYGVHLLLETGLTVKLVYLKERMFIH